MKNFSRRKLSKPTDKLVAIAGVQDAIGILLDDMPMAGLWQGRWFAPSLLWQTSTKHTNENRISLRCPSWSWASTTQPIDYLKPPYGPTPGADYFPEVMSWNVTTNDKLESIEGYVCLRCRLLRHEDLVISAKSPWLNDRTINNQGGLQKNAAVYAETRDQRAVPTGNAETWYMIVAASRYVKPSNPKNEGYGYEKFTALMCLERISSLEMDFKRIGFAKAAGEKWHIRARTETIRLF